MGHYLRDYEPVGLEREIARDIIESRAGGRVERCHTVPHLGSYSNAAHSWGVAMLMHYIWPKDFPRLALACLSHDVPERTVGDIPSPTFKFLPELRRKLNAIEDRVNVLLGLPELLLLSEEDHRKLKICDHLELWLWSHEQILMGNQFAQECVTTIENYWSSDPLPQNVQLIVEELKRHNFTPKRSAQVLEKLEQ